MPDYCGRCDGLLPPDGGVEDAFIRSDDHFCYDCVSVPKIALVGCGASKVDLEEGETIAAMDLYDSNYFGLKREFAEELCQKWMILSANHGLLSPIEEIESYDASLNPRHDSFIGEYESGKWAVRTTNELSVFDSFQSVYAEYIVLAGESYVRHLKDFLEVEWRDVEFPFRSDELGRIGDQQRWLREQIDNQQPPGQAEIDYWGEAT